MKVTSLICTYLYGVLSLVKAGVESIIKAAKNLLKGIDKIAQAAITVCRYTIDVTMDTIIKLVKQYEKELFDMLYDALFGSDKSFWCHRLWKCLALINELLDPNSFLFRMLEKWWNDQCISKQRGDLLNNIRDIISDISQFQQVVCSAGFTAEFGISYIRSMFDWCKEQTEAFLQWLEEQIKSIKLAIEEYLNTVIDWGALDYLEKLLSFMTCIFEGETSCAEIATASNFFNDSLAKLCMQKEGSGYNVSAEYRNSTYGYLEGQANYISNFTQEIDKASKMCIDPEKLDKANKAFNLSENLLPTNEDGSISWTKIKNRDFKSAKICQYFNMTRENLKQAMDTSGGFPEDIPYHEITKDLRIDPTTGKIWRKVNCVWIEVPWEQEEPTFEEVYASTDIPKDVMLKGHNVITIGQAALEIVKNPESTFSQECKELYEFVQSWKTNTDAAKRYGEAII